MDYSNLDIFQKVVTTALEKLASSSRRPFNNLNEGELQALLNLERDKSLIIKPSDKGGNLVLMDHEIYRKMTMDLLGE